MEIRGLSLTQPWASLVVEGHKRFETRSWGTSYRSLVAIHASKSFPRWAQDLAQEEPFLTALNRPREEFHTGAILGIVRLTGCFATPPKTVAYREFFGGEVRLPPEEPELSFGDFGSDRYAWRLEDPVMLDKPLPWKGSLGLWRLDADADIADYLVCEWLNIYSGVETL